MTKEERMVELVEKHFESTNTLTVDEWSEIIDKARLDDN